MNTFRNINIAIGKVINTVNTIADLRNYKPRSVQDGDTVIVSAGATLGDADGGAFVWVEGLTVADDGGDTIKPVFAVGSGRWVKAFGKGSRGAEGPSSTMPGPKGDPGGNVLSVGKFTEIGEVTIPSGVDSISTSCRETVGDGGRAFYRRAQTGPATRARIQSSDGAWWELDERANSFYPTVFGAQGIVGSDDTAALQFAIDYIGSRGGGTLNIDRVYAVSSLTMKSGVVLLGQEGFRGAKAQLKALTAGVDVVSFPPECVGAAVIGVTVDGRVGPSAWAKRGFYIRGAGNRIRSCTTYSTAEEGIHEAGIVNGIEWCGSFDALLARPARKSGCLLVEGTDGFVFHFEGATGQNGPAGEKNITGADMYAACVYAKGANNTFVGVIGQLCDVGIRDEGAANKFNACRADRNYGHGFHVNGNHATFAGSMAWNNSLGATAIYSGFYVTNAGGNNMGGASAHSTGDDIHGTGPHFHKYGGEDTSTTNTIGAQNNWTGFSGGAAELGQFKNTSNGQASAMSPTEMRNVTLSTVGSQTVDVRGAGFVSLNATVAVTVTDFVSGVEGQMLHVVAGPNVTLQHGGSGIVLRAAANKVLRGAIVYTFVRYFGAWREITDTGPKDTGWTAMTGTPYKGAFAAYNEFTPPATYDQTFVTGMVTALRGSSQRILALETALRNAGIIQ